MVVLADHTKWNTIGISSIASLDEVDCIITDSGLPRAARAKLAERVGELIVVEVG